MAPKAAPPPTVSEPVVQIPEEDEEGEGKVAFRLALAGVTDLPCPLETLVAFGGLCLENRSAPAADSESPAEFELPNDKFIRRLGQELCDDVVSKQLEISLCDAANENALIGKASISLLPLLHDQTEVVAELELQLSEAYHIKWWPEKEAELLEAAGGKDKKAAASKAKAKAKPGAPGDEAPELLKRPEGFVPPRTIIRFSVRVDEMVGPAEDRKDWTTLTMKVGGAFALPDRLTTLGLASPADEVELHQLKYRAMCFGAVLANGELAKPKEELPEAPAPGEGEEAAEAPVPTEAEARERAERFGRSVQFKEPVVVRYRGTRFLKEFRQMLNNTGGTWVYFVPEEKPSNDPKKPNLPEVGSLSKHFVGKAWVDLRSLIRPGARATEALCDLRTAALGAEVMTEEPTLQASRAFVRLALELRGAPVAEPEPPIEDLRALAPPRKPLGKFPASSEASLKYREAVEASFAAICRDAGSGNAGAAGTAAAVQQLKKAGSYDDLRENLRGAVIRVFRERMRKDTSAVPGKPLQGEVRDELVSGTYTHLKEAAEAVLEEICLHELASAGPWAPAAAAQLPLEPESPNFRSEVDNGQFGLFSPVAAGGGVAEEARTQRVREVLVAASDVAGRNARLAWEAELCGSWPRAAEMLQSRLLLDEVRCQPREWIAYAKFCARARGRQAAAEEALRQAVQLIAEGIAPNSREDEQEVDMMLACLLLDRGRHDEAIRVFREWHLKAPSDPTFKFFLGLGLFLADEEPSEASRLLNAVGGGRLEPYIACLEKLLDYGLPSLAFTFLDQCKVLPDTAQNEPSLVLIDARASCLDRDFSAAVTRAEQLTMSKGGEKATGSAAQEAWRLQGECFFQLGDMDRALQSLNQAMTFERKFEEPGFFIRLGSVLVAKKRWKQAREAYVKSIQFLPTAEAWSGVAYSEYRSDELQMCYEALNEANLLDNERSDVWALLTLVHLRLENWTQASHGFKQCLKLKADCEDLLLEVAAEFSRPGQSRQPDFAESAARRAMELRDSWKAHAALAEALVVQGKALEAADEARAAMERLVDQPEPRKGIYDRALRWCDELGRHDLAQALHDLQRSCDQKAKRSP